MSTYKRNNKKDEELQFSYPAYEKSDAVKQAEAQLQQHTASQPSAYRSQYQDRLSSLLTQLENRPDFRYDADGDALYQHYKDRYTQNGQRAMQDTMGQAAALTGGYGSSYAQSVGQQAYNQYMTGLNDVIPELYQLARDRYDRKTADLQDQYAMYANLDAQDYSRWQDQQSLWYDELDRLTSNARYEADQDWSRYASGYNLAYDRYQEEAEKRLPVDPNSYSNYYAYLGTKSGTGKYLFDPDDEDGGSIEYNNGSVSNGNIMAMQRALGLEDNAMWSDKEKGLTGMTANEAWEAYQRGALQNFKSLSRTPISNTGAKNTSVAMTQTKRTNEFVDSVEKWETVARSGSGYENYKDYLKTRIDSKLRKGDLSQEEAAWLIYHYNLV